MKLRALSLGTAALASLLLFAGPGFAEPNHYNTNPTPEERAQTDRLNSDAAARAQADAATNAADHARYDADQARFQHDNAVVDAERDANARDRARYERDRARYDRDHGGFAHRWDAFYGYRNFHDVMAMPSRDLIGLQVTTRAGDRVGRIRDVDTDNRGRVSRVSVSVGRGQTAWLDADDLRYDPGTRAVLTDLTRSQVNDMAHMRYPRF